MKFLYYILWFFSVLLIFSCRQNDHIAIVNLTRAPAAKDSILQHIESLKDICQPGDLLVRLGDDFISDRIRYLSVKDHTYSHAGIIVTHNNKKMVCHIYPDDFVSGGDTIRYDIIDSFLNTRTNLKCALYRYDLSDREKINVGRELDDYHSKNVHFDKMYELRTDDKLYCSEMIYKALQKVTNDRIVIEQSTIPVDMQHLISVYFKKYNFNKKVISGTKIIAIDNLYDNQHCKRLLGFSLKAIP